MKTHLHLIFGPTTTGKTARATKQAIHTGAPVLVVDRIQCHPEIAVGSGRPTAVELESTQRIYLCERPVVEGQVSACEANELLHACVQQRTHHEPLIILEGGSISLLQAISADRRWQQYSWSSERLFLPAADVFRARATARIRQMLFPAAGPSLLDEMYALWADARARPMLQEIDGYRAVIAYALRRQLDVLALPQVLTKADCEDLINEIALEYYAHAQWQEHDFPDFTQMTQQLVVRSR